MAVFNGENFLDYQLNSIINNYTKDISLEIIIVDDKSTDGSVEICENYRYKFNDLKIKLIKNKDNIGSVSTFERAISASKSNIIMLSDQDDFWVKGRINSMIDILNSNKNIDLLIGDFKFVDHKFIKNYADEIKINYDDAKLKKLSINDIVFRNGLFYGCCMAFRSEILNKVLPFPKWIDAHDRWIAINSIINNSAYSFKKIVTIRGAHEKNQSSSNRKFRKRLKSYCKKLLMLILVIIRKRF